MIIHGGNLKNGMNIGFGGTMYTLWHANPPEENSQMVVFLKNISKDLEVVKAKYPNVPITGLKGETWMIDSNPQPEVDPQSSIFQFGRYAGEEFDDVDDLDYKVWYASENPSNLFLQGKMKSHGYVYERGEYITKQSFEEKKKAKEKMKKLLNSTTNVEFVSNISWMHGEISFLREGSEEIERYDIAKSILEDAKYGSYREWEWSYLPEFSFRRSMKGQEAKVTIKNGTIIKIDSIY